MNSQFPEKREVSADGSLSLHSVFYTIQGEGPFCGTPSVFIRLAGCNLQCPGCDTDYTKGRSRVYPSTLLEAVRTHIATGLVVITGGEPFRQDIGPLINLLIACGYYVQVESNGTLAPPADVLWSHNTSLRQGAYLVCSPKTGKVHPAIVRGSCCFKYVLRATELNKDDGLPTRALGHSAHPQLARPPERYGRPVYLQPMDEKSDLLNEANLDAAVKSCMAHGYVLQLQLHKLLRME